MEIQLHHQQHRCRRCTLNYRPCSRFRESPKANVGTPERFTNAIGHGGRNHRPRGSRQSVTLRCRCRSIKSCGTLGLAFRKILVLLNFFAEYSHSCILCSTVPPCLPEKETATQWLSVRAPKPHAYLHLQLLSHQRPRTNTTV